MCGRRLDNLVGNDGAIADFRLRIVDLKIQNQRFGIKKSLRMGEDGQEGYCDGERGEDSFW